MIRIVWELLVPSVTFPKLAPEGVIVRSADPPLASGRAGGLSGTPVPTKRIEATISLGGEISATDAEYLEAERGLNTTLKVMLARAPRARDEGTLREPESRSVHREATELDAGSSIVCDLNRLRADGTDRHISESTDGGCDLNVYWRSSRRSARRSDLRYICDREQNGESTEKTERRAPYRGVSGATRRESRKRM